MDSLKSGGWVTRQFSELAVLKSKLAEENTARRPGKKSLRALKWLKITLQKWRLFHTGRMSAIIDIVKNTVRSLPTPKLTLEIKSLNEKMQQLKAYLPDPESLDKEVPENIEQQTAHINTMIHSVTSEFIKQGTHIEAITIVLFSHWMRLSVFFGVSESDWQKMDYYLSSILKAVRNYLQTL